MNQNTEIQNSFILFKYLFFVLKQFILSDSWLYFTKIEAIKRIQNCIRLIEFKRAFGFEIYFQKLNLIKIFKNEVECAEQLTKLKSIN